MAHESCKSQIAVLEMRLRDTSCFSVLASIVQNVEQSLLMLVTGYRFIIACAVAPCYETRCSVVFGVTLRLLVINIFSSLLISTLVAYYKR